MVDLSIPKTWFRLIFSRCQGGSSSNQALKGFSKAGHGVFCDAGGYIDTAGGKLQLTTRPGKRLQKAIEDGDL